MPQEPDVMTFFEVASRHVESVVGKDFSSLAHPDYVAEADNYKLWRDCYEAGTSFIEDYLVRLSNREGEDDFSRRKSVTVLPAFAAAAVDEVKDAIYQRAVDVKRPEFSSTYTNAVSGNDNGVDLAGSSMNTFIGCKVLPELLSMSKVGVFVDMPSMVVPTLHGTGKLPRPYIYIYTAEQIINWKFDSEDKNRFTTLLLSEAYFIDDEETGFPTDTGIRYRYLFMLGGKCYQQMFDEDGQLYGPLVETDLSFIPFVLFDLHSSLLRDTARYQVALLNLASSDIAYAMQSNFPFYVEFYDPRFDNPYLRRSQLTTEEGEPIAMPGTAAGAGLSGDDEIVVGSLHGRKVAKGLEAPRFISPSSEPLTASLSLQTRMQEDIRLLTHLAVAKYASGRASAESKSFDVRGLEAGLSAIGLELARCETLIATYWAGYENKPVKNLAVLYPERYSLASDEDKRKEADDLLETTSAHPSTTYRKEAIKRAATLMLGSRVSGDTLKVIHSEIDNAKVLVHNPEELARDLELTLVDPETVSIAKGYPEGCVTKAEVAHGKRVRRIAESQAGARGVPDLGGLSNASREEKVGTDTDDVGNRGTRGEAEDGDA